MKRKLLTLGLALFVTGSGAVWLLTRDPDLIIRESYSQIRLGMTMEEVVAILGAGGRDLCATFREENCVGVTRELLNVQSEGDWDHRPDDNKPNRTLGWAGMMSHR